ncbi:selenobiotic family radical SAM modification target peptide [candidate division KSB1 bacterium]|nr:selenobiotic family radical SAM modification target peptide [candidate division KSB1 bacterium]
MTREQMKKTLAGIGLAGLISSVSLLQSGCSQSKTDTEKATDEAAVEEMKTSCGQGAADTTAQGSCGQEAATDTTAKGSCGGGSCSK